MFDTLSIDTDARGVATLWLNRPEKHNALSSQMIADLIAAAKQLGEDASVPAVVLAARGKSFCAGGDLGWMREQFDAAPDVRAREATKLATMLQALNTLPKPLIGRVHGNAFGGGIGMASVCDVVIGAEHVKLGLTETKLGLIPATIGPYVCARMGEAKARRVFMSARIFGAEEAVDLNILSRAIGDSDAWQVTVSGGKVDGPKPAALSAGTVVEVSDLFYATPARLKFLKSDQAETNAITDIFKRIALAFPAVHFSIHGDDRSPLEYTICSQQERIAQVLGRQFLENALEIDAYDPAKTDSCGFAPGRVSRLRPAQRSFGRIRRSGRIPGIRCADPPWRSGCRAD